MTPIKSQFDRRIEEKEPHKFRGRLVKLLGVREMNF
jgi:hypothetical protein